MTIHTLERQIFVQHSLEKVFEFFSLAENLEKLTPPSMHFRILTPLPIPMAAGTIIDYTIRLHGLPMHWRTLIEVWDPPHRFVDVQLKGPYSLWHHTHTFKAINGGTAISDIVKYQLPLGPIGDLAHGIWVKREIKHIFDYRSNQVPKLLL